MSMQYIYHLPLQSHLRIYQFSLGQITITISIYFTVHYNSCQLLGPLWFDVLKYYCGPKVILIEFWIVLCKIFILCTHKSKLCCVLRDSFTIFGVFPIDKTSFRACHFFIVWWAIFVVYPQTETSTIHCQNDVEEVLTPPRNSATVSNV